MKLLKTITAAGFFIAAIASTASAAESYRFGGGPSGGGWHPAVSAGVQLLNKELKGKVKFQYSPSNGAVDNMRRVRSGNFDSAWAHVGQVYQSWYGTGLFEKDGPGRDYRVVANVRAQAQIIAVLADSPIKTFADMKGKVVNLLARGSGSNVNCTNIFKGVGLYDQIKPRHLGFTASARALGDRQIDVFCSAGIPCSIPALAQLSVSKPVRFISLTDAEQKSVTSQHKFYVPSTCPASKDIKGHTTDAKTIAYDVWWLVHKRVSDDAVYNMLKVIASKDGLTRLSKTAKYWSKLSGNFDALKVHKIWVHPAAAKYWKERGAQVPSEIVKGY